MAREKVRPATKRDLPKLAELDSEIFGDTTKKDALRCYSESFNKRIPGAFLVVENQEGEISGAIATVKATTVFGKEAKIESLFLRPDLRGRGIGKLLVKTALSEAKKADAKHISLTVKEDNSAARKLYESEGFRIFRLVYRKKL